MNVREDISLKLQQRIFIQNCVNLKKSEQTFESLFEALSKYITNLYKKRNVFKLHKEFKNGRENIVDKSKAGRSKSAVNTTSSIIINEMITDNRCITTHELASATNSSQSSVLWIIHKELKMMKLDRYRRESDSFLNKIITADDTWVHYYDPPRKRQTSWWKRIDEKTPKKPRIMKSRSKLILIVFFDRKGAIYRHFFPRKTTVTGKAYLVLKGLKRAVDRKRPELSASFILLHDNTRPHKTSEIRNFSAENSIEELPHPLPSRFSSMWFQAFSKT